MTALKKCDHYKNNASCALQSEECDVPGCANSGYQPTLCKGKILYPSRKKPWIDSKRFSINRTVCSI